jgi:hypothetical protein
LYTPARLAAIAREAAQEDPIFSLSDRIGLVHDAFALAKAGYLPLSAAFTLTHELRAEKECEFRVHRSLVLYHEKLTRKRKVLVWDGIDINLSGIILHLVGGRQGHSGAEGIPQCALISSST